MNNPAATSTLVPSRIEPSPGLVADGNDSAASTAAVHRSVGIDLSRLITEATLMFTLCVASLLILPRMLHARAPSAEGIVVAATWSMLYVIAAILCLRAAGGYVPRRLPLPIATDRFVFAALLGTACLLALVTFVSRVPAIQPAAFVLAGALNVIAVQTLREVSRRRVESAVRAGRSGRNVVIVGRGALAQSLAALIARHQSLGYRMVGFVDDGPAGDSPCLGSIAELSMICRREFVDEVLLTRSVSLDQAQAMLEQAREDHVDVTVVPDLCSYPTVIHSLDALGDYVTMPIHRERRSGWKVFAKRSLDVLGAAFGILVASPVCLIIATLIKLDSTGPVFYCSHRIGRKGRRFSFYKFRTMVSNAESLKDSVRHLNKRQGAFFKVENDPRITRVGRWLRRYSLDELPQLFNVLIGDMSLVGPRPHTPDDYRHYKPEHLRRLEVLPGITGLWQITARRDPSFDVSMALDLEYIGSWSVRNDLRILWRTIPVVFSGAGE